MESVGLSTRCRFVLPWGTGPRLGLVSGPRFAALEEEPRSAPISLLSSASR